MTRRTLQLYALRAYEVTARLGSIAAAAAELGVTVGAISQQIKSLEDQLGQRLFIRRPQALQLTPAGASLQAGLTEAFDLIEALLDEAIARPNRKPLNVAAPAMFAVGWLFPRLAEFHRKHPEIEVRLHSSNHSMEPTLAGVDVAVRHGRAGWGALECIHLYSDELVPVEQDVSGAERLDTLLACENEPDIWEEWSEQFDVAIDMKRRLVLEDDALVLQAALNGLGVALLDRRMVEKLANHQSIRICGEPWKRGTAWFLVLEEHRKDDPCVASFIAWMRSAG